MRAGRANTITNKEWNTPPKFIESINKLFNDNIELDPCSNETSIINARIKYTLLTDGLTQNWKYNTIFINPPYGRSENGTSIKNWIKKAYETHINYNSEILMLIPVATNTTHWIDYIFNKASSICFLSDSRLKFMVNGNIENKGAPMACCFVYYGNRHKDFELCFKEHGNIVKL